MISHRRCRLAALLLLAPAALLPARARAQAAAAPRAVRGVPRPPPIAAGDSARPASIERLLAVAYPEATHSQLVEQTLRMMVRSNPMFGQAEPALRTFMGKHMSYAALRADQARVFRETYTEGEVQELTKFYASDAGRRFLAKMPAVMARSQELSRSACSRSSPS
jgi:hypothetical protein